MSGSELASGDGGDANRGRIRCFVPQSFAMNKVEAKGIHGIVISSVVPPLDSTLREVVRTIFQQ